MNVAPLCDRIGLPSDARERVEEILRSFDFAPVTGSLQNFQNYEKMQSAGDILSPCLGYDPDGMKHLCCMLKASADLLEWYHAQGISDEIYIATMKCYTRFLAETRQMTGKLLFDRYWWTWRQAGGHLFRIGELEYERKILPEGTVISIHIPSDADLSPGAVTASLKGAEAFFDHLEGEDPDRKYVCHSWLLDPLLQQMLEESSNIRAFQRRFVLYDPGEVDNSAVEWIFCARGVPLENLPERTSLQRKIKAHLLSGGAVFAPRGRLIRTEENTKK